MNILYGILAVLFLPMGWFYYKYPEQTIELQRRFYVVINWRMEPIDMAREIRSTKRMGLILIFFIVLSALWVLIH